MKQKIKKLSLRRETVRGLDEQHMQAAAGGLTTLCTNSCVDTCPRTCQTCCAHTTCF